MGTIGVCFWWHVRRLRTAKGACGYKLITRYNVTGGLLSHTDSQSVIY